MMCRFLIQVFSVVFVTSCVKMTHEDLQTKREPFPSLSKSISEIFHPETFGEGTWPATLWWQALHDPGLEHCIVLGLNKNPQIRQVFAKLNISRQIAQQKRSRLFPSLFFSTENDYQHLSKEDLYRFPPSKIPAVVNEVELSLNLHYELDLWGKNRNIFRSSMEQAQAAFLEVQWSKILLSIAIAKAYFDRQYILEKIKLYQSILAIMENREMIISHRELVGIDNEIQKRSTNSKKLLWEKDLVDLEKDRVLATTQLKFLMGLTPEDSLDFVDHKFYPFLSFTLPKNLHLDILSHRPDLIAQLYRIGSYIDLIKAAKASFYPNIDLMASGGLFSINFDQLFSNNSLFGSLAPALHLPIFTAGLLKAQLNTRRAEYDAAVSEYNHMIIKNAKDIIDAISSIHYLDNQLTLQNDLITNATVNLDLFLSRYKEGINDYLEVLIPQEQMVFEQVLQLTLQHTRNLQVLQIIRTMGGGFDLEKSGTNEEVF